MIYLFIFLLIAIFDPGQFLGGSALWEGMNLGLLVMGCLRYFPLRYSKFYYTPLVNVKGFLLFGLFILIFVISLLRTHSFLKSDFSAIKDMLYLFLLPTFIYLLHQHEAEKSEAATDKFLRLIIHVLGIYCIANLLAFVVKPTFGSEASSVLRLFGLNSNRPIFSLYPNLHPSSIGSLGSCLFILSVASLRHMRALAKSEKTTMIVYAVTGFIVMLMSDSRAGLFCSVLCIGVMAILISIKKIPWLNYSVWILPFSNILFIAILQYAASSSAMSDMSRGGDGNDIATGNSRKYIYMAANEELSNFKPIHIVGYGEYGPYGAGLTKQYMEKRFGYESEEKKLLSSVTHNTALQVIFDIGYMGLFVYLLLLTTILSQSYKLYKSGHTSLLLVNYLIFYLILNGISETFYGNYFAFRNYLFLIIAFIVMISFNAFLYKKKPQELKYA